MNTRLFHPTALIFGLALLGCGSSQVDDVDVRIRIEGEPVGRANLAFGTVQAGARHERTIALVNLGSATARVKGVVGEATEFRIEETFPLALASGESRELQVSFEPPRADAAYDAVFRFELESTSAPGPQLLLSGSTGEVRCELELDPLALDFGTVSPEEATQRAMRIRNAHTIAGAACDVTVQVDPDGDPRFRIETSGAARLDAGEAFEVVMSLTPGAPAEPTATTTLSVLVDGVPHATVPVTATFASCLEVQPVLDFGTLNFCDPEGERALSLRNGCATAVKIEALVVTLADAIGIGPLCPGPEVCPQFGVGTVELPLHLEGGESMEVPILYAPLMTREAEGKLSVAYRSGLQPLEAEVELRGAAQYPGDPRTEQWTTGTKKYADVLIVVDDGPGMGALSGHETTVENFAYGLVSVCRDLNIAVTTADTQPGSSAGQFVYPTGEASVLNSRSDPLFPQKLAQRMLPATRANATATPLEAALRALTAPLIDQQNAGFLRPQADLWIVIATDRSDASPSSVADYLQMLSAVKPGSSSPPPIFVAGAFGSSGLCGLQPEDGRLLQASTDSGGSTLDVCEGSWEFPEMDAGNDCSPFFQSFELSRPAMSDHPITVKVDGVVVPPLASDGTVQWRYDPVQTALEFVTAPGENRSIEVTYAQASCSP